MSKNIFFIGLILAASGVASPPIALAGGLIFGFSFVHPFHIEAKKLSKFLLQASVVGLGFGMDLQQAMQAGRSRFAYTAASISIALLLGWGLERLLQVKQNISFLISTGTAICGGSAVAAITPITNANEEEIAVSLGTVFVLNSVALITFLTIGLVLHMTRTQFGLWSALAIHDTSSVVGATAKFGAVALAVGTTVKLARALWIVPLSIGTALAKKSRARIHCFFCVATVGNTYVHICQPVYPVLKHLGIIGLTVTLYLIGTGLSMKTLREVGVRPLLQGVFLWILVATGSLALILRGWIHLYSAIVTERGPSVGHRSDRSNEGRDRNKPAGSLIPLQRVPRFRTFPLPGLERWSWNPFVDLHVYAKANIFSLAYICQYAYYVGQFYEKAAGAQIIFT